VTRILPSATFFLVLLAVGPASGFDFKDGDHVVLIGSTLIEREQRYGYWETALTSQNPDKKITFRNLGWSGDTVWGEARAGFGSVADGYRALVDHVRAEKPTVIIFGYGTNESFAGAEGLPKFKDQLNKLLDDLSTTKARVILMSPLQIDPKDWKYGDAAKRVQQIKDYSDAIKETAEKRRATFVYDIGLPFGPVFPLTDNGIHLIQRAYRFTAIGLLTALKQWGPKCQPIELEGLVRKRSHQIVLPDAPSPLGQGTDGIAADSAVKVKGLKPGKYELTIDGSPVRTVCIETWLAHPGPTKGDYIHDAAEWSEGDKKIGITSVLDGPSLQQAEKLRQTIIAKNELYFNRWRPANVTYLFGFRKHEQGQNAREIPQFDPLIEAKEKEIAELKKPREHVYQLVPAKKKK
jgi:lysophospholipase L1-like esterase